MGSCASGLKTKYSYDYAGHDPTVKKDKPILGIHVNPSQCELPLLPEQNNLNTVNLPPND